jgi:hypothetical protein
MKAYKKRMDSESVFKSKLRKQLKYSSIHLNLLKKKLFAVKLLQLSTCSSNLSQLQPLRAVKIRNQVFRALIQSLRMKNERMVKMSWRISWTNSVI